MRTHALRVNMPGHFIIVQWTKPNYSISVTNSPGITICRAPYLLTRGTQPLCRDCASKDRLTPHTRITGESGIDATLDWS